MQGITLAVAIIFSLLAITLRPKVALAVYITAMLWYPSYLAVSPGGFNITVGRVITLVLLARCLGNIELRRNFKWCQLDTWVTVAMFVYVGAYFITLPFAKAFQNRSGFLVDTCFTYFIARFYITNRDSLITVIKIVSLVLVPLALLGVIEACTGWQPYLATMRYCPWYGYEQGISQSARWGLNRAIGPCSHSILFGGSFAMFLPLVYYLRHLKNIWHILAYVLSGVVLVGILSSMSSGPWVMAIAMILCLALEEHERWVKPLIIFFVFLCIFIGLGSNRPFYYVIASYANPLGGSGWHRAKLIDLAIEHFGEWWPVGYGEKDPGWGPSLGMANTDVTNEFVLAGVRYGIGGVIVLCGVLITAFRGIVFIYRKVTDPEIKSLCWCLGSILFSVIVAWMSVSFFGQLGPLFYLALGIIGSSFSFVPDTADYIKQPFPYQNLVQV
jgi:hypothetical protein